MRENFPRYPILYLHHATHFSGAENSLLHLATRLDNQKFYPMFLCPDDGEFGERLRSGRVVVFPHKFGRVREIYKLWQSMRETIRVVRSQRVVLLHSNGPQTNIPASMVGRLLGIPVVWHARNLLKEGMFDIDRLAGFLPQRIFCNSEAITARFVGGRAERIAVTIINGVDLDDYDLSISSESVREEFGIPSGVTVIGMTSRLGKDKGHLTLLEAVNRLKDRFPDLWILIVGDNVFEEDAWIPDFLKKRARELGISVRVVFAGYRNDVPRLYAAMDIFVLATDAEPCGRVLLEAMAMAKPVVATNNGGTPEVVAEGVTGLLFHYGSAEELAARITHLLNRPLLAKEMGEAGRRRIAEHFTIQEYVDKTQREYLKLLGEKTC